MQRAIAARVGSPDPAIVEVPLPKEPSAGEVLCRTLEVGICGTDREILASRQPWAPEGEDFLVLGHECLARVEAVGAQVDQLSAGQLVVPTVRRPLNESNIRVDMLSFDDYTERGIVKQHGYSQSLWLESPEFLLPIDEDMTEVAVFAEPQSVAEKAVNEALLLQRARQGSDYWKASPPRALVTGQGPIAFAALIACSVRGWPVTMMGRDRGNTFRTELAESLGTLSYVSLQDADLSPSNVDDVGFDLLLECTGSDEVLLQASNALAPRGVAVWLGASREPKVQPHNVDRLMRQAVMRNHLHLGSVNAAPRDFEDALRHLQAALLENADSLKRLITARLSFDEASSHFSMRQPQGIKSVVTY